jgi:ribosomal protein S27E
MRLLFSEKVILKEAESGYEEVKCGHCGHSKI